MRRSVRAASVLLCVLVVAMASPGMWGCADMRPSAKVASFPAAHVRGLQAEQVVTLMQRAGFSDEQIIRTLGLDVRNGLAISGGVRVLENHRTEAIFLVYGHFVHAATTERGSFVFDTLTGEIR